MFSARGRAGRVGAPAPASPLPDRAAVRRAGSSRRRRRRAAVTVLLVDLDGFKTSTPRSATPRATSCSPARAAAARRGAASATRSAASAPTTSPSSARASPAAWDALEAARRLAAAWAEPFALGDEDVFMSGSTGIATGDAATRPRCCARPTRAMYRAKARGRGQTELYDDVMRARAHRAAAARRRPAPRARRRRDQRRLQPIVDLRPAGRARVEALARWAHPERGAVSPAVFIPVAEESGLIAELGRHVLRTALPQLAALAPRAARRRRPVRVGQRLGAPDRPRRAARRRQGTRCASRAAAATRSRSS